MKFTNSAKLPDVNVFSLDRFTDDRGYVIEVFNREAISGIAGREVTLVSGHETFSKRGVLRGLHYQLVQPQSRLVRVTHGLIFDVAVDLRRSSPTFGKWQGELLSSNNLNAMWVPGGFAHGYYVMSETAIVSIACDQVWNSTNQRCIAWDDKQLSIDWPLFSDYPIMAPPIMSERDRNGVALAQAELPD